MKDQEGTFIDLAVVPGRRGREDTQAAWHTLVAEFLAERDQPCTLLDVGTGLGKARERLNSGIVHVWTQDPGPKLTPDYTQDVSEIRSRSFDIVTAFDVIEHVQDYRAFANNLLRIARDLVILTTPNAAHSKCRNPHHCREFLPSELVATFNHGRFHCGWMAEPPDGHIRNRELSDFLNDRFCYVYCCAFLADQPDGKD